MTMKGAPFALGIVVDRNDARMAAAPGRLGLDLEAFEIVVPGLGIEPVGADDLDRHPAVEHRILRQIDDAGRALAEDAQRPIAAQGFGQGVGGHAVSVLKMAGPAA